MIENFTDIGVRISDQMDKLDLKQVDICRITGISKNAMSNYVNGNRVPDTMAIYNCPRY
jgi:transcriptional regulator with XRE-family HTH domain